MQQAEEQDAGKSPDEGGIGFLRSIIGGNQQQTINFKLDGAGVRMAAFCCVLQLALTMVMVPAVAVILWSFAVHIGSVDKRVDDVKLDIATQIRADINSLKDGEKAVRAYINTGRMPVITKKKDEEKGQ